MGKKRRKRQHFKKAGAGEFDIKGLESELVVEKPPASPEKESGKKKGEEIDPDLVWSPEFSDRFVNFDEPTIAYPE